MKAATFVSVQLRLFSKGVILLPLLLAGCSDVLGLEELSFEESKEQESQEAETSDAVGGSAARASGGASDDGDEIFIPIDSGVRIAPPPLVLDFPAKWPQGVLIDAAVIDELNSPYWYYDPAEEELHSFKYNKTELDEVGAQSWPGEWSYFFSYETDEGRNFFGYEAELGFLSEVTTAEEGDELIELFATAGTSGRTQVLRIQIAGEPFTVAYTQESGSYRYFPSDSATEMELCTGNWESGWTQLVGYRFEDVDGILLFNSETKILQFRSLEGCSSSPESDFGVELGASPSLIFSFPTGADTSALFFYFFSGEVQQVGFFDGEEGMGIYYEYETGLWREDLTQVVPLSAEGAAAVITYDTDNGVAELRGLFPLDDQVPITVK